MGETVSFGVRVRREVYERLRELALRLGYVDKGGRPQISRLAARILECYVLGGEERACGGAGGR